MSFKRPFLDKLLLSFIDANLPSGDSWQSRRKSRERNLFKAKKALLLGEVRNAKIDDRGALMSMAEAWHRDRMIDMRTRKRISASKPRSIRTLANEACCFTSGNSVVTIAERLRSKFKKEKEEYLHLVRFGDDVDESIERDALEKVQAIIGIFSVKLELDGEHLAAPPVTKRKAKFSKSGRRERI